VWGEAGGVFSKALRRKELYTRAEQVEVQDEAEDEEEQVDEEEDDEGVEMSMPRRRRKYRPDGDGQIFSGRGGHSSIFIY